MSAARRTLAGAHRLVIKLGTHVVIREGVELASERLTALVDTMAALRKRGCDVVLVTSGAVGMGMRCLGVRERSRSLGLPQNKPHTKTRKRMAFRECSHNKHIVELTQQRLAVAPGELYIGFVNNKQNIAARAHLFDQCQVLIQQ